VVASGATVVIRPDSGDPKTVCVSLVDILGEKFGYTTNDKGYKVLNNVRLIQVGNTTALLRRSWCVVCGVWCVVCGLWCVVCGVWCVDLTSPRTQPTHVHACVCP